jgi:hypothetical protein
MNARETIRTYYERLRTGEPLAPFFAPDDGDTARVKFGISERLVGYEEIAAGLQSQTETTTGWHVDSRELRVTERDDHAWFADEVHMGWTDTERGVRYEFTTRWSGTLERRPGADAATNEDAEPDGDWRFVGMHVSTAGEL